ncbi:hypothetical protein TNCV_5062611 [Trichonephila clavipes]|nr:hypothetical protein TNCV_5062611 [Trichonephila clavipes]
MRFLTIFSTSLFPIDRSITLLPNVLKFTKKYPEPCNGCAWETPLNLGSCSQLYVAAVAKWSRHRIVAGLVTSSSPVPLKTPRVGQRCTLNLSRAQKSSLGVVW